MVDKLMGLIELIELTGRRITRCALRVTGCTAEGALRFKSTLFEERSFGTQGFFASPQKKRDLTSEFISIGVQQAQRTSSETLLRHRASCVADCEKYLSPQHSVLLF